MFQIGPSGTVIGNPLLSVGSTYRQGGVDYIIQPDGSLALKNPMPNGQGSVMWSPITGMSNNSARTVADMLAAGINPNDPAAVAAYDKNVFLDLYNRSPDQGSMNTGGSLPINPLTGQVDIFGATQDPMLAYSQGDRSMMARKQMPGAANLLSGRRAMWGANSPIAGIMGKMPFGRRGGQDVPPETAGDRGPPAGWREGVQNWRDEMGAGFMRNEAMRRSAGRFGY